MADPEVHDVREQQRMPSFSHNGRSVLHYMDFLVTWRSGRRSACSVKYVADQTPEFKELIAAMGHKVGDDFADDYRILSEAEIGLNDIWNAARIVSAAKDFDLEAQAFLAHELRSFRGWVTLAECDDLLADGTRGSRAAKALIKTGRLVLPKGERLHAGSLLRNLFTN